MAKSSKKITSIEINLYGGPLDGQTFDIIYPPPEYVLLNMGRSLYVMKTTTDFYYSEDKSIMKDKKIIL